MVDSQRGDVSWVAPRVPYTPPLRPVCQASTPPLEHSCSTALGNGYGLPGFARQAPGGAPSPYGLSCPPGCLPTEERRDAQGFASRTPCACRYAGVGRWPHASVGRPPRCRDGGLLLLARFSASGSPPTRRRRRLSIAISRALARYHWESAEADFAPLAINHETLNPTPRTTRPHSQEQRANVPRSPYSPGFETDSTFRTVSLPMSPPAHPVSHPFNLITGSRTTTEGV